MFECAQGCLQDLAGKWPVRKIWGFGLEEENLGVSFEKATGRFDGNFINSGMDGKTIPENTQNTQSGAGFSSV